MARSVSPPPGRELYEQGRCSGSASSACNCQGAGSCWGTECPVLGEAHAESGSAEGARVVSESSPSQLPHSDDEAFISLEEAGQADVTHSSFGKGTESLVFLLGVTELVHESAGITVCTRQPVSKELPLGRGLAVSWGVYSTRLIPVWPTPLQ